MDCRFQTRSRSVQIAGEILLGDGDIATKAKLGLKAAAFYARWFPALAVGEGQTPAASRSSEDSPGTWATPSAHPASSPA